MFPFPLTPWSLQFGLGQKYVERSIIMASSRIKVFSFYLEEKRMTRKN
jgi:hypothetical protein